MVEQEVGDPGGAEDVTRHHREENRRGQQGADRDPPAEVRDLLPPGRRLGVFVATGPVHKSIAGAERVAGVGDRFAQPLDSKLIGVVVDRDPLGRHVDRGPVHAWQGQHRPLYRRHAGGAADAAGLERQFHLDRRRHLPLRPDADRLGDGSGRVLLGCASVAVRRGRLDDQLAVDHVHPAGKAELAAAIRGELDRGPGEGSEGAADPEVREDDARGAIAGLLTVEDQLQRHAGAGVDQIRRVAALDRDLDLLAVAGKLGCMRPSRSKEEPGERGDGRRARNADKSLGHRHGLLQGGRGDYGVGSFPLVVFAIEASRHGGYRPGRIIR